MKKSILVYILFVLIFAMGSSFDNSHINDMINIKYDLSKVEYTKLLLKDITITSYNNEQNQTDSTPNITASNRLVYEGSIAISRDLKTKYNLKFGDIVYIPNFKTYYVIEDLMNKRFKNSVDIFKFDKNESLKIGKLKYNIIVYRIKRD